jgi:putative methionine-R-sulfoxide reductase with GAF domain
MTDSKPKYANFPERDLKVLIGPNISATTIKTLTRLSIGTYEMSFLQQEKGKATGDAVKTAITLKARASNLTVTKEASREFVGIYIAQNAELKIQVWITTPFELTQANHILWVRYSELTPDGKTGVAFKLATAFSVDDVANLLKTAEKNAVVLPAGEPFNLKGNPPPRFQKKAAADAAPVAAEAPAAEAAAPEA